MQTIASQLDTAFRTAIREAFGFDADPLIGPSQNETFGDYQSNAAMGLAKQIASKTGAKTNPRQVAEQIKAKVEPLLAGMASEVSIAGPGFLNVRLSAAWLGKEVPQVISDKRLGVLTVENPKVVVVDYSAPNVAKQMHVGHLRSTIIGDAISRVLEFQGNRVIRQNHIGDWGTQFGMLIAFLRASGATENARIEDLDTFYKEARKRFDADLAFADEARATVVRLQASGADELRLWRQIVDESRRHFQPIYETLAVKLTSADERGESFYNPMLPGNVADLRKAGIATESEGAIVTFTEGEKAPLIIEKTGGGYGYATTDLAAIRYRVGTLGAKRIVYVVGAPQSQHFKQVFATARRASWAGDALLEHAAFGSVLGEDGKMFKARSGEAVKLADLLREAVQRGYALAKEKAEQRELNLPEEQLQAIGRAVGIGAVKYADLSKDRIGDYTFSFDAMLALNGNTAPYMQYAYARVRSIFRTARERGISYTAPAAPVTLESPQEIALVKQVLRFGEVIDLVARELKPHHLCTYLYELATRFSSFYENCPVLTSEEPMRTTRLALADLTAKTIGQGLDLLGIEHPEQM